MRCRHLLCDEYPSALHSSNRTEETTFLGLRIRHRVPQPRTTLPNLHPRSPSRLTNSRQLSVEAVDKLPLQLELQVVAAGVISVALDVLAGAHQQRPHSPQQQRVCQFPVLLEIAFPHLAEHYPPKILTETASPAHTLPERGQLVPSPLREAIRRGSVCGLRQEDRVFGLGDPDPDGLLIEYSSLEAERLIDAEAIGEALRV